MGSKFQRRVNAGQLRHQVQVQQLTTSQDEYLVARETWTTIASLRAFVEQIGGDEVPVADQLAGIQPYRVTMRFNHDLTFDSTMRLDWNNLNLNIVNITNRDNLNHTMELLCKAITPDPQAPSLTTAFSSGFSLAFA